MTLNAKLIASGLAAVLLAAACGTTGEPSPKVPSMDTLLAQGTGQNGRVCIRDSDIDGFAAIDDRMVSVGGRRKEHFVITMLHRCASLEHSAHVGFSKEFGEVCGGRMDHVTTSEESCPIKSIYKFPSRREAFAAIDRAQERREAFKILLEEED